MKFFNFTPNPIAIARREMQELDVQMLAYTAELLRIQQHVVYLEKRQEQLKAALGKGFYQVAGPMDYPTTNKPNP